MAIFVPAMVDRSNLSRSVRQETLINPTGLELSEFLRD